MISLTLEKIAEICGVKCGGCENPSEIIVTNITTDSRKAEKGCLFAAIRGENTDGHKYIGKAAEAGSPAVICEEVPEDAKIPYVRVASTVEALQKIAAYERAISKVPVVGIGGSVGKTSTKEMTAAVLSQRYRLLKTEGNFNNDLGVPLTLMRLVKETEMAVIEMGISDFNEMHLLADIARPDVCILTNIGDCHLEFLGDRKGVLRAKSEMFDFLDEDGTVILNGDDELLKGIKDVRGIKPVFYGLSCENDVWADEIEPLGVNGSFCTIHAEGKSRRVFVPSPGEHMIYNALAGTAAGLHFGMTLDEIAEGIGDYEAIKGRFRFIDTGKIKVIDDCYNANPMSMKASLSSLASASGRKSAVLGDMGELGENEKEFHFEVGAFAAKLPLSALYCVGTLCENMVKGAEDAPFTVKGFRDKDELIKALPDLIEEGETVLVKASHFMGFDDVLDALTKL